MVKTDFLKHLYTIFLLSAFCLSSNFIFGQAQVYTEPVDTIETPVKQQKVSKSNVKIHSPKKAVILSAVLPGLGQVYNKKYWKLPIIYAGFGGLGYSIFANTRNWRTYRDAYKLRVDEDPNTIDEFDGTVSENNLLDLKKYYKRNLDLSVIFTAVLYALNLVDAAVDAHLFNYDISDDLSMYVQPVVGFQSQRGPGVNAGLSIILSM